MPSGKSKKPSHEEAQRYAEARFNSKVKKHKAPDYHKYGLPQAIASDINDYVDNLFDAMGRGMNTLGGSIMAVAPHISTIMAEYQPEGDRVLDALHEALDFKKAASLNEAMAIPPGMQQIITHVVKPDTASYVLAGGAMGISLETVYHIMQGLWERLRDLHNGQSVSIKEMRAYAKHVREHTDKRTRLMIADLRRALQKKDWIKAAQIQREIYSYGQQVGYHKVQEDAGVASALPANNVGSGHIAGANKDPPGPSKLFRKVIRRKKIVESDDVSKFKEKIRKDAKEHLSKGKGWVSKKRKTVWGWKRNLKKQQEKTK